MAKQEPNEDRASELNNRGYELAESGHWQEAISLYQEALRLNPRNVNSLTNMGNAMQALGRIDEALVYQDKALTVDPDNPLAWANKGVILSGLDRRPEAISCYERSIEIDPHNKVSWFNKGVALFLIGKKSEALECLDYILENIDSRMKNVLGAKAEILKTENRTNEAAKCLERMKEIESEGEPFSFASVKVNMNLFGKEVDTSKMLRGFEAMIRQRTGLPQITADFMPSGKTFEPTSVEYSNSRGYRIYLQAFSLLGNDADKTENDIVTFIQNHARKFEVHPTPPPIPSTEMSVQDNINFDTNANYYDALAHDGGCLIAFYREKQGGNAVLLRHVPPIGIVHYRFLYKSDYNQLLRDAAEHCSTFLDISYLEGEDMSKDTLRMFLREHDLYGWNSKENAPPGSNAMQNGLKLSRL